ncbi:hypothetical protein HHL28_07610 [Aerophototrophica crusticola]|uniref:Uncharacterized protein n=1 Tax=Aerophototrophica crusticola TaxID=1709002 RepID=A0A858R6A7_9PROT|nr:hypothetical protein HHL28_07610 [Rhodospirillaceae bacterium B3]
MRLVEGVRALAKVLVVAGGTVLLVALPWAHGMNPDRGFILSLLRAPFGPPDGAPWFFFPQLWTAAVPAMALGVLLLWLLPRRGS